MVKIISKVLISIALGLIIGVSIGVNNEIVSTQYFSAWGVRANNEISPALAKEYRQRGEGEYVIEKKTTTFNHKMAWINGLLVTSISTIILLLPNILAKEKK